MKNTEEKESMNISSPIIKVVDTDFSKGRLGLVHELNLEDLEKFHGHLCDGLIEGFLALYEGLKHLYPNGIVDRTNTRIVSKASPCLTDAAIYLTGGRYQYNSFYVSNDIEGMYIVQRIDDKRTIVVGRKDGVKPGVIDELGAKAIAKELNACELDNLKTLEDDYSKFLLGTDSKNNFWVNDIDDFKWAPVFKNDFTKTDVINKNIKLCNH